MTDKKISELTAATALSGTELVEVVQGGANVRATTLGLVTAPFVVGTRDFQIKREDFVGVAGSAWGTGGQGSLGIISIPAAGSNSVFFPSGAQSLLRDATGVESLSAAAINSPAGARTNNTLAGMFRRMSCSAKAGGFLAEYLFGFRTSKSDQRAFVGVKGYAGDMTANLDPSNASNAINMFGIGKDQADTNLQLMYNNASGAANKVDLGVVFTALDGKLLRFRIYAPVGGTTMDYDLHNIDDDVHYSGTISNTAELPATDATLQSIMMVNTGGATTTTVVLRGIKVTQYQNYN